MCSSSRGTNQEVNIAAHKLPDRDMTEVFELCVSEKEMRKKTISDMLLRTIAQGQSKVAAWQQGNTADNTKQQK